MTTDNIDTERLILEKLNLQNTNFIYELVNTADWIKNIGDRNVHSTADAQRYIQNIIDNPDVIYWTVKLRNTADSVGIITLLKRTYLVHHDIGFAFLPQYTKNGYAYEAAKAILDKVMKNPLHQRILAITIQDNPNSIRLLEKLGLIFDSTIEIEAKALLCYSIR